MDNRLVGGIDVEPVDDDGRIDPKYVFIRPFKHVFVLFEEADELVSEASRQLRSYLDRVLWVLVVQFDGF